MKIGGITHKRGVKHCSSINSTALKKSKQNKEDETPLHENNVKIVLCNFNDFQSELAHRFTQLKEHWNEAASYNRKGFFQYNFNHSAIIDGGSQQLFTNPYDVKISHTHQVIIVLDQTLKRLLFFDLDSLEIYHYIKTIDEGNSMAIELEYCDKKTDALYIAFGANGQMVKYDLETLLESVDLIEGKVWIQDNFDFPNSTIISYGSKRYNQKHHHSENTVYVCDGLSDCIAILEASTGEPIGMIEFNFDGTPQSIDFLNRQLVVSLFEKIIILEMDLEKGWKCVKSFGDADMSCSYLVCDEHSNRIIGTTNMGLVLIDVKSETSQFKMLGSKANTLALDGPYLYYGIPTNKTISIFE